MWRPQNQTDPHRFNLPVLYLIGFIRNAHLFGSLTVPFFLDHGGLNYSQFFRLEAVFAISITIFEIPSGMLSDRLGRIPTLFLGNLLAGISFILFGTVQGYYPYLLVEILSALGFALISGTDRAFLFENDSDSGSEKDGSRVRTEYANLHAWELTGMLIALPIGSWIAGMDFLPYPLSLTIPFKISGGLMILASFLVFLLREPRSPSQEGTVSSPAWSGIRILFLDPNLRTLALNFAFVSSATFLIFWFYQPLLTRMEFPIAWYGWVGAAMNLGAIGLLRFLPAIEKRISLPLLLAITSFVPGFSFVYLALSQNPVGIILALVLIVALRQLRIPVLSSFLSASGVRGNRATLLSGVSFLERLVLFILYLVVGPLGDRSLVVALLFSAATIIVFSITTRLELKHLVEEGSAPEKRDGIQL